MTKKSPSAVRGKDIVNKTNGCSMASNIKIVKIPRLVIKIPPINSNFQSNTTNKTKIIHGIVFGKFMKNPLSPGFAPDNHAKINQNKDTAKSIILIIFVVLSIFVFFIYAPKNLKSSNIKNAGQTRDFKNPNTPDQKPVAVDIKYIAEPISPRP